MTKTVTTPVAKAAAAKTPVVASAAVKPAAPAAATPATATTPAPATATAKTPAPLAAVEQKKIDMNKESIKDAIAKGKALIKEGKSKADAAMVIFKALKTEEKSVVIAAFVQGANLTDKGAVTYWYNCRRKAKKAVKQG